jgi:predicted acylesterase/phospholipase RssA
MPEREAVSFADVLSAELDEIARSRQARGEKAAVPDDKDALARARAAGLVGLAFSGGGIRSATFNLGVLQGLAKLRLLPRFDYLSTVSGGGYIGSWLCSWIKRAGAPRLALADVQQQLARTRADSAERAEPDEVNFLRSYSSYLTPRRGALSTDTWTIVTTYFRNLVLNLAVLVPALTALLLVPYIGAGLFQDAAPVLREPAWAEWPFGIAFALLLVAITVVSVNLVGPMLSNGRSVEAPLASFGSVGVWFGVVAPILVAAWCASLGVWLQIPVTADELALMPWVESSASYYATMWILALIVSLYARVLNDAAEIWTFFRKLRRQSLLATLRNAAPRLSREQLRARTLKLIGSFGRLLYWSLKTVIFALVAGAVSGLMFYGLAQCFFALRSGFDELGQLWLVVVVGLPLVVLIYAFTAVVHIGLVGRDFSEEAREWWARLGAVVLIASSGIALLFAVSIYGPPLVDWLGATLHQALQAALVSGWLASSIGGALLGKGTGSREEQQSSWARRLVVVSAPYIFVLGLLLLLAWAVERGLPAWIGYANDRLAQASLGEWPRAAALVQTVVEREYLLRYWPWVGFALLLGLALFISWRLGINEFSLHAGYRNRLVRCYLGASRRPRRANPFTGFDPDDDGIAIASLRHKDGYGGPYPIINTTLNLVHGQKLAWQTRKAASFVFTPRYCGYEFSRREATSSERGLADHAYRPTEEYGGSVSLGTAMAISGAAASPNMGYHSSPALGFLMTVFNVRLGWWLGNPRHPKKWRRPGPSVGLFYLLRELLGLTNNRSSYVYLSDGGHFENLGIYELVRRRCQFILVCDAGEDHAMTFGDLGMTIERVRADLGVQIDLNVRKIRPPTPAGYSNWHCAMGKIHYDARDPKDFGWLLYVKASMTDNEPTDVAAYRARRPAFPHESTADQWFDESQFESYRALGEHIISTVLSGTAGADAAKLAKTAAARWYVGPPARQEGKRP